MYRSSADAQQCWTAIRRHSISAFAIDLMFSSLVNSVLPLRLLAAFLLHGSTFAAAATGDAAAVASDPQQAPMTDAASNTLSFADAADDAVARHDLPAPTC